MLFEIVEQMVNYLEHIYIHIYIYLSLSLYIYIYILRGHFVALSS